MRIHVTTRLELRAVPVRRVEQFLGSLTTVYAGLRFALEPDYGARELELRLRRVAFDDFGGPRVVLPGPPSAIESVGFEELQVSGVRLLRGELMPRYSVRFTPYSRSRDALVSVLLADWDDADAFQLRFVAAGSLDIQTVLNEDLKRVREAIRRLFGSMTGWLPGNDAERRAAFDGDGDGELASTVRDVISEGPNLADSMSGRVSLGLIATGMSNGLDALRAIDATAIVVEDDGMKFADR